MFERKVIFCKNKGEIIPNWNSKWLYICPLCRRRLLLSPKYGKNKEIIGLAVPVHRIKK